jgi:DNA-binding PadR family transcriptional regulator
MQQRNDKNLGLSRIEHLILEILAENGELFGLELVGKSNGDLKRGTVYVTLARMEEKGLLRSKQQPRMAPEIGIPRRIYSITGYGERILKAWQASRLLFTQLAEVVTS